MIKIKVKYFLLFLFLVVAYCFNTQPKKKNTFIIYDPLNPINTIQSKKDSFQRIEFNFEIDPFPYFEDSLSYAFINEILDQVKYDTREDYFSDDLSSSSLQYLISLTRLIREFPRLTDRDAGCFNKCNAKRNAVFLPIPGNPEISSTAFAKTLLG